MVAAGDRSLAEAVQHGDEHQETGEGVGRVEITRRHKRLRFFFGGGYAALISRVQLAKNPQAHCRRRLRTWGITWA